MAALNVTSVYLKSSCSPLTFSGNNNNNKLHAYSSNLAGFQLRRGVGGVRQLERSSSKPSALDVKSVATNNVPATAVPATEVTELRRSDFPKDFFFGGSSSALQTEGNLDVDGRGPSFNDSMVQADKGFNATDSYNMYMDDIKALKDMGMTCYRFALSWTRICPKGRAKSGINQKGIDFYNKMIDEVIKNGLTPIVTLMHFEVPLYLQEFYKSFLDRDIVDDFKGYADLCFEKFGDRVKYWTTINEPYNVGSFMWMPPGIPGQQVADPIDGAYTAMHNLLLAHASAVDVYRTKYQDQQEGEIGISLSMKWIEPYSEADNEHAQDVRDHEFGWLMDPLYRGEYPDIMRSQIPSLPKFTDPEKKLVQGSYDFVGFNYYITKYAKPAEYWTVDALKGHMRTTYVSEVDCNKDDVNCFGKYQNPDGLRKALMYITDKYDSPKIIITENGYAETLEFKTSLKDALTNGDTGVLEKALRDESRIYFLNQHLIAVAEAIRDGANVAAYCWWSLIDSMEPGQGYNVKMGLYFTDYLDGHKRYPKASGRWFKQFLDPKNASKPFVPQLPAGEQPAPATKPVDSTKVPPAKPATKLPQPVDVDSTRPASTETPTLVSKAA